MPTAAKLFAALAFAAVAFFASESVKPLFPEGAQFGIFTPLNTGLGMCAGWLVMGRLAGRGYGKAMGSGLRTSAVILFYGLLIQAVAEMLKRSTDLRYDGPMDALTGMVELSGEFGFLALSSPSVMGILIVGGILGGLFAEWAAQRWR
ncbi:cell division protein FtsX [Rhodovulum iodosum]|uniref:Cell division protein FtsX n=1 Tax=Rhodovulum iodosum TaxID=68291 RepID=A0ABV3XT88_9RHOB|nr:TrgA family protein [Rhodovulum robiginosum]RSK32011.1 tellurium resistance protein [Rhodovulum robiginosum]